MRRLILALTAFAAMLAIGAYCTTSAKAASLSYSVEGGTAAQRAQLPAALGASSFDWSVIPAPIRVHLVPGVEPHSSPGHVWLDPRLLGTGRFAWATIQDEFAHQIDFYRLDDDARAQLNALLGSNVWCHAERDDLPHSAYGCERFTAVLVWAYWQAPDNAYRPTARTDESAAAPPARFRQVLDELLRPPV